MDTYYVWLVVAGVCALAETLSLSLITVWFVIGALAAFVAALLGAGILIQTLIFLLVSVAFLVLLRPVIMKYRKKGAEVQTSLIGQEVVVCETIEVSLGHGRVQTSDKMTWKAQTKDGAVLEEGAHARVVAQESIKLIVERI